MPYYFNKTVESSFDEAVSKVTEELKKEGFGILTEIDVTSALKKKINVNFRKYKILGACTPPLPIKPSLLKTKLAQCSHVMSSFKR